MGRLVVSLVEWPESSEIGPRYLGRLEDRDLVEAVRDRIVAIRKRDAARLAGAGTQSRLADRLDEELRP